MFDITVPSSILFVINKKVNAQTVTNISFEVNTRVNIFRPNSNILLTSQIQYFLMAPRLGEFSRRLTFVEQPVYWKKLFIHLFILNWCCIKEKQYIAALGSPNFTISRSWETLYNLYLQGHQQSVTAKVLQTWEIEVITTKKNYL